MTEKKTRRQKEPEKRKPRVIPLEETPFYLNEVVSGAQSYWFICIEFERASHTKKLGRRKWTEKNIEETVFIDPKGGEGYLISPYSDGALVSIGTKIKPQLLKKIKDLASKNNVQLTPLFDVYQKLEF